MRDFEKGDRVRFKKVTASFEEGEFIVVKVSKTQIGKPCTMRPVGCDGVMTYPYPSDCLELVKPNNLTTEQKAIRDLTERVEALERKLGMRL